MFQLDHRVRVFVFQVLDRRVEFLLLRHKPRAEWPLGPVVGPVGPADQLEDAIRREVAAETGLRRPVHLLPLQAPQKDLFGDIGIVAGVAPAAGADDRRVRLAVVRRRVPRARTAGGSRRAGAVADELAIKRDR
jgi:8-oxo-dGTP pyrophosphatase MutT (NUDIX family)